MTFIRPYQIVRAIESFTFELFEIRRDRHVLANLDYSPVALLAKQYRGMTHMVKFWTVSKTTGEYSGAHVMRRSYVTAMLAMFAGARGIFARPAAPNPIVLYCDLSVAPAREQEMLNNFHNIFKPAAMKNPGYIDVKLLRLRSTISGSAAAAVNYRFQLTYESEELRQKWIKTDVHQKVWPTVENTLSTKDYATLLFDSK